MLFAIAYIENFTAVPPDVAASLLAFITAILGWILRGFKKPPQ